MLKGRIEVFRNVKSVELVEIPLLETCVLPSAFKCVEELRMENGGKLESIRELKELVEKKRKEEERKRKEEEERRKEEEERERKERERKEAEEAEKIMTIHKLEEYIVDGRVGVIVLGDGCCNDKTFNKLDLRGFVNLRELKVGNECFMYVDEVKIIGLSELESVEIGMNSFIGNSTPNRHFYLKNCPKLKSLKMGRYSFSDYTVIEIENVNALEVIEMGDVNEVSRIFYYASLELKSILIQIE